MQTPANMLGHVSSAACRPGNKDVNDLVPFRRVVGAVCVRVVRRLLGIRRYQIDGQNNHPPLVDLTTCLVRKSSERVVRGKDLNVLAQPRASM